MGMYHNRPHVEEIRKMKKSGELESQHNREGSFE
jgi:hypothetical protein